MDPITALGAALPPAGYESRKLSPGEAIDELGGPSEVASILSGTRDKKSRAYKSAMQSVYRYRTGKRTKEAAFRRLLPVVRMKRTRQLNSWIRHGVLVNFQGRVTISADSRWRSVGPIAMKGAQIGEVLRAWDAEDFELAARYFYDTWSEEYGWPALLESFDEVDYLTIEPQ